MIRAFAICVVFVAGVTIGHISSPHYESKAIEGCEGTAININNMLTACETELVKQLDDNMEMFETLFYKE